MEIAKLFSTREREKLLEFILNNPNKELGVMKISKAVKLSPAHVSRAIKLLSDYGMVRDRKIDLESPLVRALKILLNTKSLLNAKIRKKAKIIRDLRGIGVYGSWADGTNEEESDLDIWIRVKNHPGERKIAEFASEVRRAIGKNVQVLVLTDERIRRLKKADPTFFFSLVFGSIRLHGEIIEQV